MSTLSIPVFIKASNEKLDYQVDWQSDEGDGPYLEDGETISTSVWITASGITASAPSNTTTTTTIWLEGGTVGYRYRCTNRITTSTGRTAERSIDISIQVR